MTHTTRETCLARMRHMIEHDAFVKSPPARLVARGGGTTDGRWLFDFRSAFLKPEVLADLAALFWEEHPGDEPLQIGGMETASIPLVTALVYAGHREYGKKDLTGFFIRKSRKKDALMKAMEGSFDPKRPIILVDDIVNSGTSLIKQIETIEGVGGKVTEIWTVLRYRDHAQYEYFAKKSIPIRSLFSLNDFEQTLHVQNLLAEKPWPDRYPYRVVWRFVSEGASFEHVLPKSDPICDDARIYFGSDRGTLWALDKRNGSVAWSYDTKAGDGRGIFSSPALASGVVIFGSYDGNIYALDAVTGKPKWIAREGDWIGSSPAVAMDLGLVFIGLEFGLWRKRGGFIALDLTTGKRMWRYAKMPCYTHSSPLYIYEHQEVVIGSNDGAVYLFDAKSGTLKWRFEGGALSRADLGRGDSPIAVKESFAYDAERDLIIFGNMSGSLCFVERKTGQLADIFRAEYGFFSTPVLHADSVLASSLDKHLYCIDLETRRQKWRFNAGARIFATPVVIDDRIYIGSNSGKMVELDPATGREQSFLQLTERITNKIAYDAPTKRFFVPTQANELYCIERSLAVNE